MHESLSLLDMSHETSHVAQTRPATFAAAPPERGSARLGPASGGACSSVIATTTGAVKGAQRFARASHVTAYGGP